MLESPFCGHSFTELELNQTETIKCACGKNYRSRELLEYNRLSELAKKTNADIGLLVKSMAAFNTSFVGSPEATAPAAPAYVPPPKPVKPPKPKRERPKLSVTQWLIVTAGFMVLVAASVFVGQNLRTWNVWGWSTLELSLGLITGFGAFRLKKFSVLLSNFLAVFSSSMLLTLIMSISTQFGLGFQDWDKEPAWFWSINLAIVATVSLFLASRSKNFGWRAVAPLSISASAIVLVFGAGTFADNWRTTVLSIALFVTLIFVRLARDAAEEVPKKGKDSEYLIDLHKREDQAIKRFGVAIAVFLSGYAAITVLQSLVFWSDRPLDGLATVTLAVVWLAGARLKSTWVTSITDNEALILNLRNAASTVGLSALGLGAVALAKPLGADVALGVALGMVALAIVLEHFVKVLLLPKTAVTIAIWLNLAFATIWSLSVAQSTAQNELRTGWFFAIGAFILLGREWFELRMVRALAALTLGVVGPLLILWSFRETGEVTSVNFAVGLGLGLILVNLYPVAIGYIAGKQKLDSPAWLEYAPLVASPLVILMSANSDGLTAPWATLTLSVGYFITVLAGSHLTEKRSEKSSRALIRQGYFALALQAVVLAPTLGAYNVELLRELILVTAFTSLLALGFGFLKRNTTYGYVGYLLVSANLVFANDLWSSDPNLTLITILAILIGGLANLGLLWLTNSKTPDSAAASVITKVVTALSLGIMSTAGGYELLHKTDSRWTLLLTMMAIAIVVGFKSKSSISYIYAGMAYFVALGEFTILASAGDLSTTQHDLQLVASGLVLLLLLVRSVRRTQNSALVAVNQVMAGVVGYNIAMLLIDLTKSTWSGPEIYSLSISAMLVANSFAIQPAIEKYKNYLLVDLPVAVATLPSIVYGIGSDFWSNENQLRFLLAATVIWGHNLWRHRIAKSSIWLGFSYATGVVSGVAIASNLLYWTKVQWTGPEFYALSIAATTLVVGLQVAQEAKGKRFLTIDLPVLIGAVPSLLYAVARFNNDEENLVRFLIAALIIWAHSLLRLRGSKQFAWLASSYISGIFTSVAVAANLIHWLKIDWEGPEFYTFTFAIVALVVASQSDGMQKGRQYLLVDLPVFIAALPSLVYGLAQFGNEVENSTRFLLAAVVIWSHNIWRTNKHKNQGWLIATVASGLFFAWAAVRELLVLTKLDFEGPEIYSVFVTGSLLVAIRLAKQQKLFKSSIVPVGLPLATILTPSVYFTWFTVTEPFESLNGIEITRTILSLVLAIAALIYGLRAGNKGAYLVGTFELWLVGVPALWFKSSLVADDSVTGEFRGLIVAGLIFWAIALLRSYNVIKAKSLVYLGIPVTIALTPALVDTLGALGGAELRTVDWWRFSIVLTASLALLILGSLRELGGTFFPGLLGVIITVLPYGFHPISNKQWFLWIILLGVAALLVWLAVRLENMRKNGREPSAWLKELK